MPKRRFIIISVPPPDIAAAVDRFRKTVAAIGSTRESLTYPPHITLRTGALVPPDAVEGYQDRFSEHIQGWTAFSMETTGLQQSTYEADGEKRHFIGYGIELSPSLTALNRHLLGFRDHIKSSRTDFNPHLTIAFHDLSDEGAGRIRKYLSSNPAPEGFRWTCDNVALYEKLGDRWEPVRVIHLHQ